MEMACQVCPVTFHGRRDAKYCSNKCRERAARQRAAGRATVEPTPARVVTLSPKAKPAPPRPLVGRATVEPTPARVVTLSPKAKPAPPRPLVVAIEKQLTKAERIDTPAGQMALVLAERLASGLDTGSALATLSRELTARMGEALAGATIEPDELDELAERRLRKVSSA